MTASAPGRGRAALATAALAATGVLGGSGDALGAGVVPTGAAVSAVTLSSCASSDNGFPDLAGVTVQPRTLDVRDHDGWLTVTARPVDDGGPGPATGITEVGVSLTGLGAPTMKPQSDGTWIGRLRVPRGVKPGQFAVESVRLRDGSSTPFRNLHDYFFDPPEAVAMGASVQVVSDRDRQAPRLRWLRMSTAPVDVTNRSAHIRVRARVTDDAAGVMSAALSTDSAGSARLTLRHGTRRDGVWAGTLSLSRWTRKRSTTYSLLFGATDRPGNDRLIYSDDLARRGMPSSLTVTTRTPDTAAPQLTSVRLTPATVDLTAGSKPVTVTVHARDDRSGVGSATFFPDPLHRVAGDRMHGVWRGTLVLDHCLWRTDDVRLPVALTDRADNTASVRQPVSITNNSDIRAPYPGLVGPEERGATEPVTYRFNEDVVGISDASVPVRPTFAGVGFGPGDPPPAVHGTWSCATSAGAPVDCRSGPVRSATWTPAAPLTAGQSYGIDVNPEHVLDVMDLAGNPVDPGLRYTDEFAPTWHVTG